MKTKLINSVFLLLFTMTDMFSQETFQQSYIELGANLQNNKTYLCQATTSIKLLPGFSYSPTAGNEMKMEIDRYSVFPPDDGYHGGWAQNDSGVVGSLIGDYSTNNSGGVIYTIDLKLPKAILNVMPKLALVYDNQSGNGIMGWAWNLSGLSSINRVGTIELHDSYVSDVDFVDDRFSLDGLRLIAENYSSYGEDGTVYRTEIDNMDKIVSYTDDYEGPKYFKVWKNDGTIWEYGSTADSRLEAKTNSKVVIKWMLKKVSDREGNAVVFNYHKDVNIGELNVSYIEYTSNENAGVKPAYKVEFQYDNNRKDAWYSYVNSNMISVTKLLKHIVVRNNYTNKVLFDYSLEYHEPTYTGNHHFMHYRLKSVGLTIDDDKINPTRIIWNDSKKHYPQSNSFRSFELNKTVFSDVPFVGDFNGDGFSDVLTVPYKIQNTYPGNVTGKVYLNNGDGTFGNSPITTITFNAILDWIYVLDLDNDGVDDIISYDFNDNSTQNVVNLNFYLMKNNMFVFKDSYSFDNSVQLYSGNYVSNENAVIVMESYNGMTNNNMASYFYCDNGYIEKKDINASSVINGKDANYVVLDMSGDGLSEILALYDNDYKLFRIIQSNNGKIYNLELYASGNSMDKGLYPFPNDFNGDGKTDMLYYNSKTYWNLAISGGDNFLQPITFRDNLLWNISLNPQDRYRCSLKEMEEPSVTIRTADFDGDGFSDVGVFKNFAGNHYLEIGFQPYVKSNNTYNFTCQKRYYMPINYSHQAIHIGRFLAQENVSILSSLPRQPQASEKAYITSLYPHSSYYSVERIVDGMGNIVGFSYDYLMDRLKTQNNFYSSDHTDLSYNIRTCGIPLSALKTDTIFNINDKAIVTKYEYKNALIHTKGHGFLGFETVVSRTYMNNNLVQKQIKESEISTMNSHAMALPSRQKLYHGENQLVKDISFMFKKYEMYDNDRIISPQLYKTHEINYSFDRQTYIIKNVVTENNYQTDTGDDCFYDNIVSLHSSFTGYDSKNVSNPKSCQFWDEIHNTYNNKLDKWIINRYKKVRRSSHMKNGEANGNIQIFEYNDSSNPLRITKEYKIPNLDENMSDPLLVTSEYQYDKVGNTVCHTISSPSISYKKIMKQEFGEEYQYRYATKIFDEFNNVVSNFYDNDYGIMMSTLDYNHYVTSIENDPVGVTDMVTMPDGTQIAKALRWSKGNDFAPNGASYYSWEKTTGNAESIIFYHKSGVELRTVNIDINGRPIFVDKRYDDFGNLIQESLPYFQGETPKNIVRSYDKYNRLHKILYPNASYVLLKYDINTIRTEYVSSEGVKQHKTDTYNSKEWLIRSVDIGGNVLYYEYYSDGLLKSTQIDNLPLTKVSVTYDNCRNKKTLNDPDYGTIIYEYDALSNLKKVKMPNNNYIEYQYDVSGRMIDRKERDASANKVVTTKWHYNAEKGKIGMLERITTSDNHIIEYVYDDKLRLSKEYETINNTTYFTTYSYDEASRVSSIRYPSGFCLSKTYSNSGYEKAYYNEMDDKMLWMTNSTNPNGNITEYQLGNGLKTMCGYNPNTFMIETIRTISSDNKMLQNLSYGYDDFGNLMFRKKNTGVPVMEEFEYDDFNRLKRIRLNGAISGEMVYDDLGNITAKTINGVKVLYNTKYDVERPHAIVQADTDDETMFNGFKQNIVYSSYDNAVRINEGSKRLDIIYGSDNSRIYSSLNNNGKIKTKVYVGDCEIVNDNGTVSKLTYLSGPMGVFAVCVEDAKGAIDINYINKDNIDSWNIITDDNAEVLQRLSFDAWGNRRDSDTWDEYYVNEPLLFDRGFTGHEHLTDFALINMNGRIYDPMMSMMLSPDNNIQMLTMSQNFNRYSYCLNNPLKFYDPTGEWVENIITGVFSGFSNVIMNVKNLDNFGEGMLAFTVGFAQGFIRLCFFDCTSWLGRVAIGAAMNSVKYGTNEFISVSDGVSKLSGDDWNKILKATSYGLGNGFISSIMKAYAYPPMDNEHGLRVSQWLFSNQELAHFCTSVVAHSMGCWFSGQPLFKNIKLKDIGLDLEMFGHLARRILSNYILKSDFADEVMYKRSMEIKQSILDEVLLDDPEFGDFNMSHELDYVMIDYVHVYIVGNVYAYLPGIFRNYYKKPYIEEMVAFPFSFSLFHSIFFKN